MVTARLVAWVALLTILAPIHADDDPGEAMSAALRPLLIQALPEVLYEKSDDWGRQKDVANGIRWHGLRPQIMRGPRNDGRWRKTRVTAQDPAKNLELRISDFKQIDADKQTFRVFLAFQAGVEIEKQHWEDGIRLSSGSIRARLRIKATLECEKILRIESTKKLLPNVIFRLRVTEADVSYDNLVVEHIAGVGGTAARLAGEALRSSLKQWKPSLERNLLERANRAILKAADTRELRIGSGGK